MPLVCAKCRLPIYNTELAVKILHWNSVVWFHRTCDNNYIAGNVILTKKPIRVL